MDRDDGKSPRLGKVIVGKQRHGPFGVVTLHFNGARLFSDYVADDHLPEHY